MKNIDFLPAEYREAHDQRRATAWRLVLVVSVAVAIVVAALGQQRTRHRLMKELEETQLLHKHTSVQHSELSKLEGQLDAERHVARLMTYLRHPWPKTQILKAILDPLTDEITLERIRIVRETPDRASGQRLAPASPSRSPSSGEEVAPPAQEDLKRLREQFDSTETVVWLHGVTNDHSALHAYLVTLGKHRLFNNAQLKSVESSSRESDQTRFMARLTVTPGYGQPGAPARDERDSESEFEGLARASSAKEAPGGGQ